MRVKVGKSSFLGYVTTTMLWAGYALVTDSAEAMAGAIHFAIFVAVGYSCARSDEFDEARRGKDEDPTPSP